MLVDDPNKHFGFLDKSRRFKDIVDSEKDRDQVYKDLTSSNAGDKRGNHERIGSLNHIESPSDSIETKKKNDWQDRYDKMEILKLKLENERLEQVYQKQIQSTRKELNATLEKCAKLEAALQSTVKEKIAISGTTTSKEKDYQDLLHKHASLLQKVPICLISLKSWKRLIFR